MQNYRRIAGVVGLLLAGMCVFGAANGTNNRTRADTGGDELTGMSLVGVSRETGELWRYDLANGELTVIGTVRDTAGHSMRQLGATAWFDGFGGLYGFWREPEAGRTRLVYVNLETATAREEGVDLGPGVVRGGAARMIEDAEALSGRRWRLFAVQEQLGLAVEGQTNLNPNNSSHSEFVLETPDGTRISRDDLHHGETDENGVYYRGPATMLRLKPKGNANRNGITLDGRTYRLRNGRTYYFQTQPGAEPMEAVVYNAHPNPRDGSGGGKGTPPMGHWWIGLSAGSATVGWESPGTGGERVYERPRTPRSRLVRIDTGTGTMEPVAELERDYGGLACDEAGEEFFAVHDGDVYRIDPEEGTETRISRPAVDAVVGLQRTDEGRLVTVVQDGPRSVAAVDGEDGSWLSDMIDTGSEAPGATVLVPTEGLPSPERVAVD